LLGVIVREDHALFGDALDVRRAIAHQAHGVSADIGEADIIAHDHEEVGLPAARSGGHLCRRLLLLSLSGAERRCRAYRRGGRQSRAAQQETPPAQANSG
jgi:hypothetical protein